MIRALLVAAAAWLVYVMRDLLGILLVSVLLAAVMDPIVDWFEKKRVPRSLSALLLYALIFIVLGVIALAIVPPMMEQMRGVAENFGDYWKKVMTSYNALHEISARYGLATSFQNSINALNEALASSFAGLFSTVTGVFSGVISFFVMLVIAFFLVVEKNSISDLVNSLVPAKHRDYVGAMLSKMQVKVGHWMGGQLMLMLFIGILTYVGLAVMGIKFALLLAIIAGLLEVVPYIGPVVATIPAVFFAASSSPTKALLVLALYILIQRIENMVLVPKIMQKTTGLNPITVILALAIGFTVGGVAGGLLAVPVTAALNVFLADYLEKQGRQGA